MPRDDRRPVPERVLHVLRWILFGLVAVVAIAVFVPNFNAMQDREREEAVRENMRSVQLAAEDFGAHANGRFPATSAELASVIPSGATPKNPFTGVREMPAIGRPVTTERPGTLWYEPVLDSTGACTCYRILGQGRREILKLELDCRSYDR